MVFHAEFCVFLAADEALKERIKELVWMANVVES